MKFFDDSTKKVQWWNRNYFFIGTIIIVLLNIILFAVGKNNWTPYLQKNSWGDIFNFHNIWVYFLNAFEHANWQHCLLNMLCFFVAGTYIERKIGSLNLLSIVFLFAFFADAVIGANYRGSFHGFSGVNYALYGFVIIDYLFSFRKKVRNKTNIIYGGIVLGLIYLAMCYNGGTTGFGFDWYPYDLMTNMAHYSGLLAGVIMSLVIKICKIQGEKIKGS